MRWLTLAVTVVIGIALAILGTTPQSPASISSDEASFSAERAMEHVRIIAAEPHPTGSVANAKVRSYLVAELEALGAEVSLSEGSVPERSLARLGRWSGEAPPDALTLTNVIGVIPGRDRAKPAIALMAHHDTVWGSPGASDDTAGVASILEAVRAITSQGTVERDIIVLMTDGEELGLLGAQQFIDENPLADKIGGMINLEARGAGGRTTLFQTSKDNRAAIELYAGAVSRPGGSSLATFVYEVLPNDTDLTPALERPYVAYNLSFIGRPGLYHSAKATPENLDQGAVQDMGDQTLELTLALANADELPEAAEDRTFFDVFGIFLLHYGAVIGWVLLALAAVLHVICLRMNQPGGWWRSLAASAVVILGGGLALYTLNAVSGQGAGESVYYDRLAAIPMLEAQALLICIAALAVSAPLWAGRRGSIVGILIALAMQIFVSTTAFLVVWPLLLAGIVGVVTGKSDGAIAKVVAVVCGGVVLGLMLQFGHQFMQGVGPDAPMVVALLAALMVPVLGPMIPAVNAKRCFIIAGACLVGALAIATWVRFDPVADTMPIYDSMNG